MTTTAALVPGISAAGQHYLDQGAREFFETQGRGTRCTWHSPSTATNPRLSRRKTPNEIVPDDCHHSRPDRRAHHRLRRATRPGERLEWKAFPAGS